MRQYGRLYALAQRYAIAYDRRTTITVEAVIDGAPASRPIRARGVTPGRHFNQEETMSRGQGRLYRQPGSTLWWLDYSVRGARHRESSGTSKRKKAIGILRERVGGRETGTLLGRPDHVTFAHLRELAERQYQLDGRRSLPRLKDALNKLEAFFGAGARALDFTPSAIDAYAERRLAQRAARATVNYELAALRRAFRLAVKKRLLAVRPEFDLPKVHNERQGFFEEGEFAALLLELPAALRPVIQFARLTGWRVKSEILALTWDAIDWDDQAPEGAAMPDPGANASIRLAATATKGGEARIFPFGEAPDLAALLLVQWRARDSVCVFHRGGRRIKDFRTAWDNACKRAGLEGRIPHDLRRSAARDLRRAGVSEGEIMKLCGWKTRAMFDRYNIIDEQDLARAVAKRFTRTPKPKPEPAAEANGIVAA